FVINDSYYGPERYVPVSEYMRLWEPYERTYVPVYRPDQEPVVAAILGADWDPTENVARYISEQREVVERNPSANTWMSLGYGLYRAGQYEEAVQAYAQAVEYGLSRRTLWYTAWPAASLNALSRHTEALSLANAALGQNPASSEMLLERGAALEGLGREAEAVDAYRLAARYAPYLARAQDALHNSQ
ncbi:MAG: tetratricopeptide repeat protein, partial [Chloroflexota bacterium]|nr:tetratricopeptide repeat protein [Chloroflexota bacterium]